ncbi:MAG: antitoxin [Methylococcaceae bacterium]
MENQPLISVPNMAQEITQLKAAVSEKLNKCESIKLDVLETDLERIKTQAIIEGIPYQLLMSSILHKYAQGYLIAK